MFLLAGAKAQLRPLMLYILTLEWPNGCTIRLRELRLQPRRFFSTVWSASAFAAASEIRYFKSLIAPRVKSASFNYSESVACSTHGRRVFEIKNNYSLSTIRFLRMMSAL